MRKITFVALMLFIGYSSAQLPTNHIILIDNSGSMRGRPVNQGNLDIWEDVKKSISDYISQQDVGDIITIYKFSGFLSSAKTLEVTSKKDLKTLQNYVINLKAIGGTTCLYTSIYQALQQIKENELPSKKILYVFTDFVSACKGETYTIDDIKKEINKSTDLEHMYYISLGKEVPEEIEDTAKKDSTIIVVPNPTLIKEYYSFPDELLKVDFSVKRTAVLELEVPNKIDVNGTSLPVEFITQNDNIKLEEKNIEIKNGKVKLNFSIPKSFYDKNDAVGTIKITSNEKLQILKGDIKIVFTLPKKNMVVFPTEELIVDFTKARRVVLPVNVTLEGNTVNKNLAVSFNSTDKNIKILTETIAVDDNKINLALSIPNEYYTTNDASGELSFSAEEDLHIINNTLKLKFVLPKKRKVTITFKK